MNLKVIQSFRMKPIIKGTGQYFGWEKPIHALLSLSLSLWQLNRLYSSVLVYTDKEGKIFLDKLNFQKLEIKILPEFLPITGTMDKLYACSQQEESFVHLDSDVFIQAKLPIIPITDFLLVQHNFFEKSLSYIIATDLEKKLNNKYEELIYKACFDTSLLGGSHGGFFKSFFEVINESISKIELGKLPEAEFCFWIYSLQLAKFATEQKISIKFHHELPTELQYPFLVSERLIAHSYCKLYDTLKKDFVTIESLYRIYFGRCPAFIDLVMTYAYEVGLSSIARDNVPPFIRTRKAFEAVGLVVNSEFINENDFISFFEQVPQSKAFSPLLEDVFQFEKLRYEFLNERRSIGGIQNNILMSFPSEDKEKISKTVITRAEDINFIESKWDWAIQQCDLNDFSDLIVQYNLSEDAGEHITLLRYHPVFDFLEEINMINVLDIALLDSLTKPKVVGDLISEVYRMFVDTGNIQQDLSVAFEEHAVKRICYFIEQRYVFPSDHGKICTSL